MFDENEKVESRVLTEAELRAVVGGAAYLGIAATKLLRPLPAARRARLTTGAWGPRVVVPAR
jgi:hypothetical protein